MPDDNSSEIPFEKESFSLSLEKVSLDEEGTVTKADIPLVSCSESPLESDTLTISAVNFMCIDPATTNLDLRGNSF